MALMDTLKTVPDYSLDMKAVNNIKALGIDMIESASSGHPGIVLGAAPILYRLYNNHLVFDNKNPNFINRDRFVMSAGHGSALLYATLFMSGFDLTVDDLKDFRKYGSKTPGHPELNTTAGVDMTTGPLGQGFASAVGMAIGGAYLNQKFKVLKNSLIDHFTYVFCSDGDLMEGISSEAASIAGSLGLGKLIVLYDSNDISLDGSTKGVFDEDVLEKFKAMGWDTHLLSDAYDFETFDSLIEKCKNTTDKPSIIKIKTIIGKDSKYEGTSKVHGKPLEKDDIKKIKKSLDIRDVSYTILSDAYNYMKDTIDNRNSEIINKWERQSKKILEKLDSKLVDDFNKLKENDLIIDLKKETFKLDSEKSLSGREISNQIINKLSDKDIMCVGTDTMSSTKVFFENEKYFSKKNYLGKNINCGVRELSASAICNGLELMGIRAITSSFLSFSNYMIPSIRMASLMELNPIYIFTHDSVLVGEDGPTHQPIEQIDMLRSIPNVSVFRPCDKNEFLGAYMYALKSDHPCVIVASKENLPSLESTDITEIENGGYVISKKENEEVCLIASGYEMGLALKVSEELEKHMINSRVVSMVSLEQFSKLSKDKQEKILPKDVLKVVIELSSCINYYKYLSSDDLVFGVNQFMKSGNKYSIIDRLSYNSETFTKEISLKIRQKM